MKFTVEMQTDMRRLRLLNVLAEKVYRRRKMLVFRVVVLALGVWVAWLTWISLAAGLSFTGICKLVAALFLLTAGAIPNTLSAWFAQASVAPAGTLTFEESSFLEAGGGRKIRRKYSEIYALLRFRGYDFIFLDQQSSLIIAPENVSGGDAAALRAFLESRTGKPFQEIK